MKSKVNDRTLKNRRDAAPRFVLLGYLCATRQLSCASVQIL